MPPETMWEKEKEIRKKKKKRKTLSDCREAEDEEHWVENSAFYISKNIPVRAMVGTTYKAIAKNC